MTKLREWLIKLQDQVDGNTQWIERANGFLDWALKLVIGTLILALLGTIIIIKGKP